MTYKTKNIHDVYYYISKGGMFGVLLISIREQRTEAQVDSPIGYTLFRKKRRNLKTKKEYHLLEFV